VDPGYFEKQQLAQPSSPAPADEQHREVAAK
jgi:hypothetical protein